MSSSSSASPLNTSNNNVASKNTVDMNTRIALAACILAAAAFMVATIQANLEYLSSGPSRHKCTYSAIGYSSLQVRWRLSWWRLKVFYPLIRFDSARVSLFAFIQSINTIEQEDFISQLRDMHQNWGFRTVKEEESLTRWHLADNMTVLIDHQDNIIKLRDIPWSYWWRFLMWRRKNPLYPTRRPRASWAQLLVALSLRETKGLSYGLANAETTSGDIDVPTQRIKLRDLGILAFIMGFTSVKIDVPKREFRALSPHGTISTEHLPGLGKILKFDGDILAFHRLMNRCASSWHYRARYLIDGRVSFGNFVGHGLGIPLGFIGEALKAGQSMSYFDENLRKNLIVDDIIKNGGTYAEATLMNNKLEKLVKQLLPELRDDSKSRTKWQNKASPLDAQSQEWLRGRLLSKYAVDYRDEYTQILREWQVETGNRAPTLLVASTFMSIHGIVSGFPSGVLLEPFMLWFRRRAKSLSQRRKFITSEILETSIGRHLLSFAKEDSHYLMSDGSGGSQAGLFGWGISNLRPLFEVCPVDLRNEMFTHEDGVQAVLTRDTASLLEKFSQRKWLKRIESSQLFSPRSYKPLNLLWIQVMILDILIQFLITDAWGLLAPRVSGSEGNINTAGPTEQEPTEELATNQTMRDIEDGPAPPKRVNSGLSVRPTEEEKRIEDALVAGENGAILQQANGTDPEIKHSDETAHRETQALPTQPQSQGNENGGSDDIAKALLDRFLYDERFNEREAQVAYAITKSWRLQNPPEDGSAEPHVFEDWDLVDALEKYSGLTFATDDLAERKKKFEQLANLLELRGMFVICFLFNHPDSTDVYFSESDNIEMPMA